MAADRRAPWRRLTTVRARTTIAATAIVGLALLVAAVSLVVALRRSLVTNIDEVWGHEFGGDANIVEVYVRYLRRKVDGPFGLDTIETVRHVGYRMVSDAA